MLTLPDGRPTFRSLSVSDLDQPTITRQTTRPESFRQGVRHIRQARTHRKSKSARGIWIRMPPRIFYL